LALRQLIDNGLKYSSPAAALEIAAEAGDRQVVILIRDRGPASQEGIERVFEKFYRRDSVRQRVPGSGLGLYIAREIARAHGGELTVESTPGEGAEFRMTLPAAGGAHRAVNAGRILVVDDEPQIRRVLRATLTSKGYEVVDARTGEEALEALRDSRFNLVLLDINMPGIGGLETCREIRASSEVSIIMLTVHDAENDKVAALDAGADDYVTKPFSTPELLARIRAALRRQPNAGGGRAGIDRDRGS